MSRGPEGLEHLRSLGSRLRATRLGQKRTLEQIASSAGLTRAFLSQVERGDSSVSLDSLVRICDALNITVGALFDQPADTEPLRKHDRLPTYLGGQGVVDYLLTSPSDRRLQVFETRVAPRGSPGDDYYTLDSQVIFLLVLCGTIELDVQDRGVVRLAAGDSTSWSPRTPYRWRNPSASASAACIWAIAPAVF